MTQNENCSICPPNSPKPKTKNEKQRKMKAEVTIKIEAPGLEVALQSLAQAIANKGEINFNELRTDEPTKKEGSTNAEAKKQSIAEKILELGGTPPEKGSVAKFQAAFEKVSANALAATEK